MFHHQERPLREQLIEARAKIVAQLGEIQDRSSNSVGGMVYPPDYRDAIAELEGELGDIDALLGTNGKSDG